MGNVYLLLHWIGVICPKVEASEATWKDKAEINFYKKLRRVSFLIGLSLAAAVLSSFVACMEISVRGGQLSIKKLRKLDRKFPQEISLHQKIESIGI